ncbi:MAG: helix-turn-helix transcriptional regulator [Eubacterium sp.]|nr:helix-turn-helix transcriptional regulator [Eubacterium sp.]
MKPERTVKMRSKVIEIAKTLNNLTSITTRCYRSGRRTAYYPSNAELKGMKDSFAPYRKEMLSFKEPIGCITTPSGFIFGFVKNGNESLVLGPVKKFPAPKAVLENAASKLDPSGKYRDALIAALRDCPRLSVYSLVPLIAEAYELLNFDKYPGDDRNANLISSTVIDITFYDGSIGDLSSHRQSLGAMLESLIEKGDVDAVREWMSINPKVHFYAEVTDDRLRNTKDSFILASTLYGQAASLGGLERSYILPLLLDAIKAVEKMDDPGEIGILQSSLALRFAEDVKESKRANTSRLIRKAAQIIQRDIFKPVKVNDVAEELGVSRGYLSNRFREETGMTFKDYIIKMKIREAKGLIESSSKTLISISTALGFSSQSHFTRAFRKETGMTPKEYSESMPAGRSADL